MDELALQFFPFPHEFKGQRRDGLLHPWPARCGSCDRQCQTSRGEGLQLCSYGLNYQRIDGDLLVAGLAVSDYPQQTPARSKMLRALRGHHTTVAQVSAAVAKANESTELLAQELRERQTALSMSTRRRRVTSVRSLSACNHSYGGNRARCTTTSSSSSR